jgi:hypothetical protein
MNEMLPNTTVSTDATLFREEAERARRYAAAMTDKKIIDRLNEIAALYDELAAGRDTDQIGSLASGKRSRLTRRRNCDINNTRIKKPGQCMPCYWRLAFAPVADRSPGATRLARSV